VLYLACDRPNQIARAMRRSVTEADRAILDDRLAVWQGPPPADLAKHPDTLLALCREADADTVVIDSLKDVALGLSDDEVGAGLNRAMQTAIVEGVEVVGLHHQRKGQGASKPTTLEDVYGSTWITAGAGSVLLLWGSAGDWLVELTHLKQPASVVGPLQLEHDHDAGTTTVTRGPVDALVMLRNAPTGLTSTDLAQVAKDGAKPTRNDVRRARRTLDRLVDSGHAHREEPQAGGAAGTTPARYYLVDDRHRMDTP